MVDFQKLEVVLDEETLARLSAMCLMYKVDDGKKMSPEDVIKDSVARLHVGLLKAKKASYVTSYKEISAELAEFQAGNAPGAEADPIDYPGEFADLETGIESIFLKRRFKCPMCENAFTAPQLKTGSLLAKLDDRTQMDVYVGVRQDSEKEFVDYSLFHIMICPQCLYAALEREFDIWDSASKEPKWIVRKRQKVPRKVMAGYHDNLRRRAAIAQRAGDKGVRLFSTERTEDDATVAIDLAADTLQYLIGKLSANRRSELLYQLGMLHLIKSLQFEKQLEDPDLKSKFPEIKKKRLQAIKDALTSFMDISDQAVENFDVREGIRFNARKFWAAHELKNIQAFAAAGGSIQRIYNQFNNLVKKAERDLQQEESKIKKMRGEMNKAKTPQKKEVFNKQIQEAERNMGLVRGGLENYRGVVRVANPIYDSISVIYDKFKEMQRKRRAAQQAQEGA